ncbi:MAG: NUDIX domain-containing protein [Bdellovibrionales bacterium]|jgi:ADP-ribose pyrophosphatase|nr:NUDIX domain-containing protein [Bdellovibrionales bacterium]
MTGTAKNTDAQQADFVKIIDRKVEFDGYHRVETITCQPKSLRHEGFAPPMTREVMYCNKIAAVLLYAPETDKIMLNQQFRLGALMAGCEQPFLFEAAAGGLDEGETPEDAARREAREETGAEITDIEFVSKAYTSAGCLAEEFHLFVGRIGAETASGFFGLEDEGEEIKTHFLPAADVIAMLDRGDITNAPSAILMHWFARHHTALRGRWLKAQTAA